MGDAVEARFGGEDQWYGGKVTQVRGDGTYDILYEDGDSEEGVAAALIRSVGGAAAPARDRGRRIGSETATEVLCRPGPG